MAVRKEHSFFECCQTPDLASEITLQPIRRYSGLLDAAIILCVPSGCPLRRPNLIETRC